jgi:hypothetical protein
MPTKKYKANAINTLDNRLLKITLKKNKTSNSKTKN